jgi:hypothetical protein
MRSESASTLMNRPRVGRAVYRRQRHSKNGKEMHPVWPILFQRPFRDKSESRRGVVLWSVGSGSMHENEVLADRPTAEIGNEQVNALVEAG